MSAVILLLISEEGPNVLQGGSPSWGLSWTRWRDLGQRYQVFVCVSGISLTSINALEKFLLLIL